ncbi:hypothetical protein J6590_025478 [Homalodisca vitripennis]|nr:hypothetical protein J6590_025478 [Homalodisca vitripennis]
MATDTDTRKGGYGRNEAKPVTLHCEEVWYRMTQTKDRGQSMTQCKASHSGTRDRLGPSMIDGHSSGGHASRNDNLNVHRLLEHPSNNTRFKVSLVLRRDVAQCGQHPNTRQKFDTNPPAMPPPPLYLTIIATSSLELGTELANGTTRLYSCRIRGTRETWGNLYDQGVGEF